MEVTDFTLTRIIASNTLNAQTDKPFAEHAEKVREYMSLRKIHELRVLILIIFLENGQQLYYDPSKEWCNWRDQVDCDVRPECDENDQNCKDPHHTTTPKPTKCDSIGK